MHARFFDVTNRGDDSFLRYAEAKAGFYEKVFHVHVFGKQGAFQPADTFLAGDFNRGLQQIAAQPAVLILVGDNKGYFGIVAGAITDEPGHASDMPRSLLIQIFSNQRELAVIVNEALGDEPLVRNARVELQGRKITQIYASL